MQQERESQTFYFKDLLFCALYQWKAALIVALILALILGGIGTLASTNVINLNTATITPEMQIKIDQLQATVEMTRATIESQEKYLEESVYMALDPYQVYTAGFHVVVYPQSMRNAAAETLVIDNTAAIIRAYRSAISNESTINAIAEAVNIQSPYLRELIAYDSTVPGYLGVTVRGRTAQEANSISHGLLEALKENTASIEKTIEPHTIQPIPFEGGARIETALHETQTAAYQKLTSLKNTLATSELELSRLLPTELTPVTFSPALLAAVGAVLGIVLTACFAWVAYIGGGKIYSARILTNCTGIRVLGCISGSKRRHWLTKWLRKLEGRSCCACTDAVAVNIRNRCQDIKTLVIMGQYCACQLKSLTEKLEASGIRCHLCKDPTTDPEALEALPQCDGVVLALTCMDSRYDQVQWTMETVADHGKSLLGCVLIDG